MIWRYLLCICFGLKISLCVAQSPDSLRTVMLSKKAYKEKISAYLLYEEKYGVQNFDKMLQTANEGLELAIKNKDPISIAELKRYVGEAWYFKGKYDSAVQNFFESIAILEKAKEDRKLAAVNNSLAKLYRKTRDLKRSLATYEKALSIFRNLNDSAGIAMIMNESGVVYEYGKDYPKAIERYATSLQINKNLKDSTGIAYALGNLAGAYTLQEKYSDAETYLLQALNIRKRLKDSFALALNYSDLGTTYASSKNFEKARLYLDTSNLIADKMQYPELKQNNLGLLAELAEKQGDFKTALNYFSKRVSIRDSLFGLDKTKQIEELSTKYETVKKEQQIQEQQNRIVQQKIIIIAGIISLLLILALAYTQYKRIKWKQEAKLQAEILMQQELATKAIIKAEESERERIAKDLHDSIGQMLSAAKMNLSAFEYSADFKSPQEKQTFEKIITLVDESCKEVRTVSHHMMPNALVKNNLAAALTEFTARLDDKKLKVHLFTEGLDERLDTNVETVLYRVIQECVNNVIKHSDADTLDISVVKDLNEITATIEDNGKGFEVANKKDLGGIGLKNISTRIEYLKGSVDFDSTPGRGTLVAIHVPL